MVPLQYTWGRTPVLGPILGYTGVIPLLIHIKNTPRLLYPQSPQKTSLPRKPTYPAGYPHDPSTTPMGSHPCAWPLSLATKRCRMPQNTYSGSHRRTFAQGLPKKRVFPWYPPGGSSTHMVPLQYPWGRTPVLGPVLRLHWGHTLVHP